MLWYVASHDLPAKEGSHASFDSLVSWPTTTRTLRVIKNDHITSCTCKVCTVVVCTLEPSQTISVRVSGPRAPCRLARTDGAR